MPFQVPPSQGTLYYIRRAASGPAARASRRPPDMKRAPGR